MDKIEYSKIQALLLDLDGTLINSEKAFYEAFKTTLCDKYKVDITKEEYKKYELEQNAMLIDYKKKEYPFLEKIDQNEIFQKIYENYMPYFERVIQEQESADNFKIIKELKESGMIVALVTTCRRIYISKLLDLYDLHNTFDLIIAREGVPHELLKPNPEEYLLALKKLNLSADMCLSIEDSKRGIDAAVSANIPTIKVSNFTEIKYNDERVVEEESAHKVLSKILYERKF